MATDLAEFIGAAIGFKLLLGVSLLQGAVLTGIATFLILMLQKRGQKPLELVIGGLLLSSPPLISSSGVLQRSCAAAERHGAARSA